ncbi:MAG TPA: hypothetical protein VEZ90_15835 [Blastocatellia bacterium]|nr:hypothetical protein [Blastocatellia bacterium]
MSKTAQESSASTDWPSTAATESAESLERLAADSYHLVTQIWSDAKLLVFEFNRDLAVRPDTPSLQAVSVEIEAGLMRLASHLRAQIGFDLRLEVEYKRNPPQMIRTLRHIEQDGSTGLLILCDSFHFALHEGMVALTVPDGSSTPSNEVARALLEPLFNRLADAL